MDSPSEASVIVEDQQVGEVDPEPEFDFGSLKEPILKAVCAVPEIESSVQDVLRVIQAHISDSHDREVRLKRQLDMVAKELSAVKDELVFLRSAMSSPVTSISSSKEGSKPGKKPGSRTTGSKLGGGSTRTQSKVHSKPGSSTQDASAVVLPDAVRTEPLDASTSDSDSGPAGDDGFQEVRTRKHRQTRQAPLTPIPVDNNIWQLIAAEPHRPKRSVLYVGNLSVHTTEERLREFVDLRCQAVDTSANVQLHSCSLHTAKSGKLSAKVTIDARYATAMMATNFWPRPVYCRLWKFDPQPTQRSAVKSSNMTEDGSSQRPDSPSSALPTNNDASSAQGDDLPLPSHAPPPDTPVSLASKRPHHDSPGSSKSTPDAKRDKGLKHD